MLGNPEELQRELERPEPGSPDKKKSRSKELIPETPPVLEKSKNPLEPRDSSALLLEEKRKAARNLDAAFNGEDLSRKKPGQEKSGKNDGVEDVKAESIQQHDTKDKLPEAAPTPEAVEGDKDVIDAELQPHNEIEAKKKARKEAFEFLSQEISKEGNLKKIKPRELVEKFRDLTEGRNLIEEALQGVKEIKGLRVMKKSEAERKVLEVQVNKIAQENRELAREKVFARMSPKEASSFQEPDGQPDFKKLDAYLDEQSQKLGIHGAVFDKMVNGGFLLESAKARPFFINWFASDVKFFDENGGVHIFKHKKQFSEFAKGVRGQIIQEAESRRDQIITKARKRFLEERNKSAGKLIGRELKAHSSRIAEASAKERKVSGSSDADIDEVPVKQTIEHGKAVSEEKRESGAKMIIEEDLAGAKDLKDLVARLSNGGEIESRSGRYFASEMATKVLRLAEAKGLTEQFEALSFITRGAGLRDIVIKLLEKEKKPEKKEKKSSRKKGKKKERKKTDGKSNKKAKKKAR